MGKKKKKNKDEELKTELIIAPKLSIVEQKIQDARNKITTINKIEKLAKEVARLEKSIATKQAKIEELAEQL